MGRHTIRSKQHAAHEEDRPGAADGLACSLALYHGTSRHPSSIYPTRSFQHVLNTCAFRAQIYGIGDNPASDIRGANRAGHPWVSTLVRTGVFRGGANSTSDPAQIVVEDVEAAVDAGLHRARSQKWHSMR